MSFILSSDDSTDTVISNSFIENFMPSADGNFVKIYIYLVMLFQHGSSKTGDYSVSSLADRMECTEKDICRALRYWQKRELLSLEVSGSEITHITIHQPTVQKTIEETATAAEQQISKKIANLPPNSARFTEFTPPAKQSYTPLQAEAFMKDSEINRALDSIERILGEPVSPAHLQTVLYFMCDIGFSADLVVTLYETAVKKGKKKTTYIEAIGLSWASQGITTPEQALEESLQFSGRYATVSKAFGIQGNLKPAQREIVDSWNEYQFADSIIAEACKRTVLQTGDANFQYASKILENWHKKQVISLQDIEKCDESYKKQKASTTSAPKGTNHKNQFQNFPQRDYTQKDYDSLEKKLLRN